ncbi:MAG: MarR family transcriptional regulator [Clostridia bacterium]|nr:MarR family transcriptional regulator [Clostridia bacterium]
MSLTRYIGQTSRAYSIYRDQRLEKFGLVGYQSLYLTTVCRHPGITQEEIAEKLVFNKSSVARQIATLEERGFVTRERCQNDKRNLRIFPTEKATALLPEIGKISSEFFALISRDLDPEEQALLSELCQRICDRAKEAIRNR